VGAGTPASPAVTAPGGPGAPSPGAHRHAGRQSRRGAQATGTGDGAT